MILNFIRALSTFVATMLCMHAAASELPNIVERHLNPAWSSDSPAETGYDHFGHAVAVDGAIAAVGAPGRSRAGEIGVGRLDLFKKEGDRWRRFDELAPFGEREVTEFGQSVALDGETLVVGASGTAYVYERDGNSWMPSAALSLPPFSTSGMENFGYAVAVSGDVIAVGGPGSWYCTFLPCDQGGAVKTYRRVNGTWLESDVFWSENITSKEYDSFGWSLALNDAWLIIGAPHYNLGSGAVAVIERQPTGWGARHLLAPDGGAGSVEFGYSVSLDNDLLAIGAPAAKVYQPSFETGRVYAYRRSEGQWIANGRIDAPNQVYTNEFGMAVAVHDGRIAVGGEYTADDGAVGLYQQQGVAWVESARVVPVAPASILGFGWSVALGADCLFVGNPFDQDWGGAAPSAGALYTFRPGLFADGFDAWP